MDQDMKMQESQAILKKLLIRTLKYVVGIAFLIAIVAEFLLTNLPKLSADVSGSLRPNDSTGTLFTLSNEGLLPAYDVKVGCEVTRVDIATLGNKDFVEPTTVYFPESRAEILSPGHKMTVPCGRAIASRLNNMKTLEINRAEMFILVTYRPKGLLWHKAERFPMETEKTEKGEWLWKSVPR